MNLLKVVLHFLDTSCILKVAKKNHYQETEHQSKKPHNLEK